MPKLTLLRHGETSWTREGRRQGHRNVPLTRKGVIDSRIAVLLLSERKPFSLIASSDLQRCTVAAEELLRLCGMTPDELIRSSEFRERDMGSWTGKLESDCTGFPPRDWESTDDLTERVRTALEGIVEWMPKSSTAVIVSHGAAIRYAIASFLEIPPNSLGPLDCAHWCTIQRARRDRPWRILEYNAGGLGSGLSNQQSAGRI